MGGARPRAADVARRLAAAIAVAGTLLVSLVVLTGSADAAVAQVAAGAEHALVAGPEPASLHRVRDLHGSTVPGPRVQVDPESEWADTGSPGPTPSRPTAFFVGLPDTSDDDARGRVVPRSRGRSPPGALALAPR